jgi:HTH-type transcriptional regulator, sugar sensing transcriptional regulator
VPSLERFGFTPTETRVYEVLLRLGASTGYAVSKSAGLARANTYQALDGLVRRGAARRSATIPARYAALSPDAVIGELERGVRRDLDSLHQALRALPRELAVEQTAVTSFDDWPGFERAAATAVRGAREEVLAVAGPWSAALLEALADSTGRVATRALSLGDSAPAGLAVRPVAEADLIGYWSGLPVAVVVDRSLALSGTRDAAGSGRGILTTHGGVVPFVRHLLRRELAGGQEYG